MGSQGALLNGHTLKGGNLIRKAKEVIAQGDLGAVVDYAIDLNRQKVLLEQELEEAKAYLREEAKLRSKGAYEVNLEGLSGTVTVVIPGLLIKTKKGADLKDLEVNLPAEVFASIFRRAIEIEPAITADQLLEMKLAPAHRATLEHFITVVDQTPKVYVPR